MTRLSIGRAALFIGVSAFSACAPNSSERSLPAPNATFPVSIRAHAENLASVPGVELLLGKQRLGSTDEFGNASLSLSGSEGDSVALRVKCPDRYASPEQPLVIGLRHLGDGSTKARFEVECYSLVHQVVVGIRADNGARLPILRLKSLVGQTDDRGVAHVLLQAAVNEPIALTLDTSKNSNLLPQNPTLDFVTRDADELVFVSQKFTIKPAPPRPRAAPRAIPRQL
ncbi:MAG TPA: hypothetical protein VJV79_08415 [Polyangiaceae bacterium]|nr:hypothetical protein [Polyangiaceae bacterium]